MLAVYTELKNAQRVRKELSKKGIMHPNLRAVKEMDHIYFPITKRIKVKGAKVVDTKFTFPRIPKIITAKDILKKKLTRKEMKILPRSQEIVGSIMIIEIPEELKKKERKIAEAYLETHPQIETVVKKSAIHSGVFRTRKVKILAGKKSKETVHHENNINLKLHLEQVYFSARTGSERLRVAKQVKKDEDVLVMFSGCGPFPLVIAKNSPAKSVLGVELNPSGHFYAMENVTSNKLENIIFLKQGDVRKILPKLRKKFDRICMPLPKTAETFLDIALPRLKKDGIIHLYGFLDQKDIDKAAKAIREKSKNLKYPVRVLRKVKCGQYSPGWFRVCFDLKLKK
ncbi:class I SAM-dependent methyltransferase family protein [Candidatus Woesearchaeota archaeon]|jgi:tRNA (guanine37-N1)-methyltransferase|nr:class I SAM-dependent methyltransferase family protein [Candidatus Woesearchaeota archaeon]MBT4150914.1 class I SAM-dependent methyltransferase family protein [Candidatus Woesearchaeota archaeon]MBT4247542.1 class I SAM-dependent methyltransferase family protein [Candidatus Woesearchaeota archaeon]MBT4433704.1 class I SAM-dependent methyltransferase family protein [Candidatus Woesearchaeota archaeon]MBT7332085.1 class I SAM-dependent methyltransferase family protein [Candidatus Woesearchaeot